MPSWHYLLLYHYAHHRDNVTAPHGRPTLRSRLHSCHAQEGGPRSPQGHAVALDKKNVCDHGEHYETPCIYEGFEDARHRSLQDYE